MISKSSVPGPAQRAAQQIAVGFGQLTASQRMLPSVLICGAQRCGTTSMYRTLTQHPAVLSAVLHKGVHYFDTNYAKGCRWYRAHFPLERTASYATTKSGTRAVALESSPYYLFHPLAAQRLAQDLPEVRIIVLLRDPVERAYSAHTHERARGFENEDFERALELEDERLAGEEARILRDPGYNSHSHQHHAYTRRGRYIHQIKRLETHLGRDRIHVVDSEDFFDTPDVVWRDMLDFLQLPPGPRPRFEKHNARPRSPMPDRLRRRLTDAFVADDEALADWWGRTPSWRRTEYQTPCPRA